MTDISTKRRIFVCYSHIDQQEVTKFVEKWADEEQVFTPYALGITDEDDFIDSDDTNYVMSRIRKNYLQDSTVTIVLIGSCTHSRRYVDWEIKASLQQGESLPNGLIGILLPSQGTSAHLPPRFQSNWSSETKNCYARYKSGPSTAEELGRWIEDAYQARTTRAEFIVNPSEMMKYNAKCKVHEKTH